MAGVQVGDLRRRRVVRKMDGSIIDYSDDTDGSGDIIRKGHVVNQPKIDELIRIENDKQLAAKAEALAVNNPNAPVDERNSNPSKSHELEKRVDAMEGDVKEILKILRKK